MAHPKSPEAHKAAGTYRKPKQRAEDPGGLVSVLPAAPFQLSKEALRVYAEEGERLIGFGILKAADLRTLAMYSAEVGLYIEEMNLAREEGVVVTLPNGISAASAHRKTAEQALKNAAALSDRLGLNPIARSRMGLRVEPPAPARGVSILDYIKGGGGRKEEVDWGAEFLEPIPKYKRPA